MPVLEPGSLPTITGNAQLTGVVAVGPVAEVDVATSVSQTGVFVYSNARTIISPVVTSTTNVSVTPGLSLSQTGIFVYAAARPVLTGITSISLGQAGSGPIPTPAPTTRQLLIR